MSTEDVYWKKVDIWLFTEISERKCARLCLTYLSSSRQEKENSPPSTDAMYENLVLKAKQMPPFFWFYLSVLFFSGLVCFDLIVFCVHHFLKPFLSATLGKCAWWHSLKSFWIIRLVLVKIFLEDEWKEPDMPMVATMEDNTPCKQSFIHVL